MSGEDFTTVRRAIAAVAAGRPVVVVDDDDRENEGDLILSAALVDASWMGFVIRHTSGFVCVAMPGGQADRLELPAMRQVNEDRHGTAYTVTVDAATGVTTGISATDRARTARLLADPGTAPRDLRRPGHVVPLRARAGGVLERRGHTEAAVDLCRLAGLDPVGVLCELVDDQGELLRGDQLTRFAADHDLVLVSVAELAAFRRRWDTDPPATLTARASTASFTLVARAALPTARGLFDAVAFRAADGQEHLALTVGDVRGDDVLTRVHSECLTGDVLGSRRCDCGSQLDAAMAALAREGRGVVVYVRGHEGRGIGLVDKVRAYAIQDQGADTVDANLRLGLPADARDYRVAADVLAHLGVRSVRLLTNNPAKVDGLTGCGIDVRERVPLVMEPTPENLRYLHTKRDRMGHHLSWTGMGLQPRRGSSG